MPCFKGIAVSVHANGNPLPEYGIQKQSRLSRISSYIPVPQPTLDDSRNKPEPAKFAISITLLTPGLPIPYSTPKPTEVNPLPKPELVGHPPSSEYARNSTPGIIAPYIPMTNSENETIAAYIYFDGRVKEEVATLLRPEATGQIKVAMFRVLASGEIKKGEYSPQFDAHDDDDLESGSGTNQAEVDVEHTTSFAKPKSLDPKTISTQTVTGIDGPDKPFATFTFFYRGERQLQKIGVVTSSKQNQPTTSAFKRRSGQLDLSHLGPLRTRGTVGFTSFRDKNNEQARRAKARKRDDGNMGITLALNDDSEDDDGENDFMAKIHGADDRGLAQEAVAPEDVRSQGELAAGVDRIRLKRAHSSEPEPLSHSLAPSADPGPRAPDRLRPPPGLDRADSTHISRVEASPLKRQKSLFSAPTEDGRPASTLHGEGDRELD
jgi:hypothetical protein